MSDDRQSRLTSVLVCWGVHAGLLLFIGVAGLAMGLLGDPMTLLSFYEPFVGDAIVPVANLIRLMAAGAIWVLLLGLAVAAAVVGGIRRARWGGGLLWLLTWLHIVGLIPALLLIHLKLGLGGIPGALVLLVELGTGLATVVVMRGSLGIVAQVAEDRG